MMRDHYNHQLSVLGGMWGAKMFAGREQFREAFDNIITVRIVLIKVDE